MYSSTLPFIRWALWGGEVPVVDDWEALFADLQKHCLTTLANSRIYDIDVPTKLLSSWEKENARHLADYLRILMAQDELNHLLQPCGITPVVLKGFSAGQYYPDPAERTYGDIDILILDKEKFSTTEKILLENKFKPDPNNCITEDIYINDRHHTFTKNHVCYEIHQYFSWATDEIDKKLDQLLSVDPILIQIDGHSFYAFPEPYNGISILEHIRHHLITGIGFRQIIDWCCYVNKVLTDEYWQTVFESLAESLSLRSLAIYITRLCELYLGLSHRVFAEEADSDACKALFEEIDRSGNFGISRSYSDIKLHTAIDNGHILRHLQQSGKKNWLAAKKHKWLRPFAWLWQANIILIRLLLNRQLPETLFYLLKHNTDRRNEPNQNLWKTLGIGKFRE